jgi:Kae1-associated kinase Bud32
MTPQKTIAQGAEATILKKDNLIIKNRIKKYYRISEIDNKIREQRTRAETKLLEKASKIINCPIPQISKNKTKITMPFIKGKKLSENLDTFSLKEQRQICNKIGKSVAKLHNNNIIHGDLTTSNMILEKDKLYFIDFGLGFISHRYEDKAVDIHLLKQALEAKHFTHWKELFKEIINEYKKENKESEKVLKQFEKVEKRGRYKK